MVPPFWQHLPLVLGIFFLERISIVAANIDSGFNRAIWPNHHWIDPDTFRGPGFYFSLAKIGGCLIVFFLWVHGTDWLNQDLIFHRFRKRNVWKPVIVGSFSLALLMMWVIPYFWPAFLLLLIAYAAPILTYVLYFRNPQLEDHLKILTPAHIKFWSARRFRLLGIHIDADDPSVLADDDQPEVELFAKMDSSSPTIEHRNIRARQLEGYATTAEFFADAIDRRASQLLFDFDLKTESKVDIRYLIDGVWFNLPPQPAPLGRQVAEVLIALTTDINEPDELPKDSAEISSSFVAYFRKRMDLGEGSISLDLPTAQRDRFLGKWQEKVQCKLTIAKGDNFERWLVTMQRKEHRIHTLDDLGMRATTAEAVATSLQNTQGMILFSALPQGGLTTLIDVALEGVDRYMRDFVSVEDADFPDPEIANVDPKRYDSTAGERPIDILPTVARSQPDVIVCRNMVDAPSAKMLCELALKDLLIISSIPARDGPETLLRMLVMKVPPELVAGAVSTVVHGRLIRKLCKQCKTPYQPSSELLKKLGIPPGRVEHLYRPATPQEGKPCEECDGIGYRGLIGIYEILNMNHEIQKILVSEKPKIEDLRQATRRAGMQTESDHGKLLVARGAISVEELQRVLKK